jgi:hypothetical protein
VTFAFKTCYFYYFAPFTVTLLIIATHTSFERVLEVSEATPDAAAALAI